MICDTPICDEGKEGLVITPTATKLGSEYAGVSTDDKPIGVGTYSIYNELDTGKRYYYADGEWNEIPCCSGGGGGGLTPYSVTLAYAEGATPAYFHGGIGYDEVLGTQAESAIKISDAYYTEPSGQISAGIYEIIPLFEGGAGYFGCNNNTAATITGDATIIYDEVYESYYVKVTGDCSITITE